MPGKKNYSDSDFFLDNFYFNTNLNTSNGVARYISPIQLPPSGQSGNRHLLFKKIASRMRVPFNNHSIFLCQSLLSIPKTPSKNTQP